MKKDNINKTTFSELLKEYKTACYRCWKSSRGFRVDSTEKLVSCLRTNGCWRKTDNVGANSFSKISACLREHGFWTSPEVTAVGREYRSKILRNSNELINFQKKISLLKQNFIRDLAKQEGFEL